MSDKKLTFGTILFIGINCLLGAGIFITPGKAFAILGLNMFWFLLICSVLAYMLALFFAEFGGIYTQTGGVYIYVRDGCGNFLGYVIGLMRFIAACTAFAVQLTAMPALLNGILGYELSLFVQVILSVCFAVLLAGINLISVSLVGRASKISSYITLSVLILTICVTLPHLNIANFSSVEGVPPLGFPGLEATSSGFLLLFYAFVGFENIGVAAQDMENPTRDVPRVIIVVMLIVSILYLLLFTSIVGVMPPEKLATSSSSVADAVGQVLGKNGGAIIGVGGIIALFGIGLSMCFNTPRNLVPLALDSYLPESAGANNARGVPAASIIVMLIISIGFIFLAMFLSKDLFVLLVKVATVARLLQYIAVVCGIFVIRKRKEKSSYVVPYAKFILPIVLIVCAFLLINIPLTVIYVTLGMLVACTVSYFVYSKPRRDKILKLNS